MDARRWNNQRGDRSAGEFVDPEATLKVSGSATGCTMESTPSHSVSRLGVSDFDLNRPSEPPDGVFR